MLQKFRVSELLSRDGQNQELLTLHEHIIQSCRHSARANGVRVTRVPCDLNGMRGGVAEKHRHETPCFPLVDLGDIYSIEIHHERQGPDLSKGRGQGQLAPDLGEVREQ